MDISNLVCEEKQTQANSIYSNESKMQQGPQAAIRMPSIHSFNAVSAGTTRNGNAPGSMPTGTAPTSDLSLDILAVIASNLQAQHTNPQNTNARSSAPTAVMLPQPSQNSKPAVIDDAEASEERIYGKCGRGIPLPTRTTRGLLKWLLEHHRNPFPTAEEKLELQKQYNLTPRQISNWFINARRRVLKKLQFPAGDFIVTNEWLELAENLTRRGRRCLVDESGLSPQFQSNNEHEHRHNPYSTSR